MPGMGSGLSTNNQTIVSAFKTTLLHQVILLLILFGILVLVWNFLHLIQRRQGGSTLRVNDSPMVTVEAPARRILRFGFASLWILDGLLQGQSSMPLGMTAQVTTPSADGSPAWVHHLVNFGASIWNNHPITAATSAVWIQIGVGVLLLVAPRRRWSQVAALISVGWGLIVWSFGEAFGGVFASGPSWLFGTPGAALFYVLAGILLLLPERYWITPRLGRVILSTMGSFFVVMGIVQAWPGNGFWQGRVGNNANAGALANMTSQMSQTAQPHIFSSWINSFTAFDSAHGWSVNLVVVLALISIGLAFLSRKETFNRAGVIGAGVLCLTTWVLVQDFGFFGGVGTDPNSMIPISLIFITGYVATVRLPGPLIIRDVPEARTLTDLYLRLDPRSIHTARILGAVGAAAMVVIGALPMVGASASSSADPIIAQAIDGSPGIVNRPAPNFTLVNQYGKTVNLASLKGKALALTFLDPVCTTDCPLLAQEFRQTSTLLGAQAKHVAFIAVVANPLYRNGAYLTAFDQQENLQHMSNWQFLTGSLSNLVNVWRSFGVAVVNSPAGAMIGHTEVAYIIDPSGRERYIVNANPGSGASYQSLSFSVVLEGYIRNALAQ